MSMTESKAPAKSKTTRPAKTTKKNALTEKIEAALAKAVRKTATLGQLVLTDLNVRRKKSSQTSIEGLAASIRSAGLLMNLVVFEMDDDLSGLVMAWTARFPCLAELDSYLWSAMPLWEARLQVSLISAELSAEAHSDNVARLPNRLVGR